VLLLCAVAGALLAVPAPAHAVDPPGVRTRLVVKGDPRPGEDVPVRVEVSWPGRPENFNPGVPKLQVPDGAAVRLGTVGSSFAKGRTRWWTDTVVTLPDWAGPWMVGPANLQLVDARGTPEPITVAAMRVRHKRGGGLVGRGAGSALVLLLAAVFVLRLHRRIGSSPHVRDRDRGLALVDTCTRACEEGDVIDFLRAAVELRGLLEQRGSAPRDGPTREALAERLDRVRFGGEEIDRDACREVLGPLVAATEIE